ncbi:MAG: 50S ribosomal protein L4 [Nanoarchaeota archaeon]|nr:50S ribosomal protein L4 [Nanoarchaeota archaeon]
MKVNIIDKTGKVTGNVELPPQFDEPVRPDLIERAVIAIQSHNRQREGGFPEAGKRPSTRVSKRRHDYRGCYGIGISRVPRKILSRRGTRMNWQGALTPGTVGGRRSHPLKAEKKHWQELNKKERKKALRSAIAASLDKEFAASRGHKVPEQYPFIIEKGIEKFAKTKDVVSLLKVLGFEDELTRSKQKNVRSGKGKGRTRKYSKRKGVLLVVGNDADLIKASKNIPGADICKVNELNAELLAPGGVPGRVTLYTEDAIAALKKEELFM